MEFGLIKSKIEKLLAESYTNGNLKYDMFIFNELVTKNKNVNKLFYIYDELSSNKGLNESIIDDFIDKMVIVYENTINKIPKNTLNELSLWTSDVKVENSYKDIDNLFSNKITDLENKLTSKSRIYEGLKIKSTATKKLKKVSLDSMVEIANKTISEHVNRLDEKTKKDLNEVLHESNDRLKIKFEILKESVTDKLASLKESETNNEVITQIDETLTKVSSEEFDKLTYVKLKELYRNL